jgi:hypothetical protein
MDQLTPQFLETIPAEIETGILYISILHHTASHLCCCGCGCRVVTPLSPARWTLLYDGKSVSLEPSVGRWYSPCQSHYWIRNNNIVWAEKWPQKRIEAGRRQDHKDIKQQFEPDPVKKERSKGNKTLGKKLKAIWVAVKDLFVGSSNSSV